MALSNILRSDRRTNIRMDREQFDGAQTRLRKLAPEGKEVADNFRFVDALERIILSYDTHQVVVVVPMAAVRSFPPLGLFRWA